MKVVLQDSFMMVASFKECLTFWLICLADATSFEGKGGRLPPGGTVGHFYTSLVAGNVNLFRS